MTHALIVLPPRLLFVFFYSMRQSGAVQPARALATLFFV
jgi:hypothetical protein